MSESCHTYTSVGGDKEQRSVDRTSNLTGKRMRSQIWFPLAILSMLFLGPALADPNVDVGIAAIEPVLGDWAENYAACDREGAFFRISRDPEAEVYTLRGPEQLCLLLDVTQGQDGVLTFKASCGADESTNLKNFKDQTIHIKVEDGNMSLNLGGKAYSLLDCGD